MAYNLLTDSQSERLALLIEEMSEAIQSSCKILRHGYNSSNPFKPELGVNRFQLETELGDVLAAVSLLTDSLDLSNSIITQAKESKLNRVREYLHHQ